MAKRVLIKPLLSEKFTKIHEKQGKYQFMVDKDANKIEIAKAVGNMYGVTVSAVNTIVEPRKQKNRSTKKGMVEGRTRLVKKAIVTLKQGEVIDFFESSNN